MLWSSDCARMGTEAFPNGELNPAPHCAQLPIASTHPGHQHHCCLPRIKQEALLVPMAAEMPPLLLAEFPRAVTFLPALDPLQVFHLQTKVSVSHAFSQKELMWLWELTWIWESSDLRYWRENETCEDVLQLSREQRLASVSSILPRAQTSHCSKVSSWHREFPVPGLVPYAIFGVWDPLEKAPQEPHLQAYFSLFFTSHLLEVLVILIVYLKVMSNRSMILAPRTGPTKPLLYCQHIS